MDKQSLVELIIFDCDGVLVDSEILGIQVIRQELKELSTPISVEHYVEIGIGRRKEETDLALKQMGISLPQNFWEKVEARTLEAFAHHLKAVAGVEDILEQIKLKKCIASSSSTSRIELSLAVTHLAKYFKGLIFSGNMVQRGKPDPDVFILAADTLKVPPHRCLVIEDSLPGIRAAKAAGMQVWGFVGGLHCIPAYIEKIQKANAALVFDTMQDLPKLLLEHFHKL